VADLGRSRWSYKIRRALGIRVFAFSAPMLFLLLTWPLYWPFPFGQIGSQWQIKMKLPEREWKLVSLDLHPDPASTSERRAPTLRAIVFASDRKGWAVGEGGTIVRTNDGGENWESTPVDRSVYLWSVFFCDETHGWATGSREADSGVIYRTNDGGKVWGVQKEVREFHSGSVNGVWFADHSHGWAVGNAEGLDHLSYGFVLHTSDAGDHWEIQCKEKSALGLSRVQFKDRRHGWAIGTDHLLYTEDEGQHWTNQFHASPDRDDYFFAMEFASLAEGWIVAGMYSGEVLHTTDGGRSWSPLPINQEGRPPKGDLLFYDVKFLDAHRGWVAASGGRVFATSDAGRSWSAENTGESGTISNLALTPHAVFAVGTGGVILKRPM